MPTNNNNTSQLTATPIAEEISARATCPPEVERISSYSSARRRNSPESHILSRNGTHSTSAIAISPTGSTGHSSALNRPHDGVAYSNTDEPVRVETTPDGSMKQMASDEEPAPGRLSPDSERSSCAGSEATPVTTAPSTSSLLSYEFSNIRVGYNQLY